MIYVEEGNISFVSEGKTKWLTYIGKVLYISINVVLIVVTVVMLL